MSDPLVRATHIRAVNLCARGARQWFKTHGLDYQKFLTEGLPASTIEGTNDAFGKAVAAHARKEAQDGK